MTSPTRSTGKSAQQLLDEIQRLAQLDAFDPDAYLGQLGDEGREPEPLGAALTAIDAFTSKAMRIHLGHVLAADTALPAPFRAYLATQVLDYDGDLPRLRERVRMTMSRSDPVVAAELAQAVADAAGAVLALRARLRAGVLALMPTPPEPVEPPPPASREELIELD